MNVVTFIYSLNRPKILNALTVGTHQTLLIIICEDLTLDISDVGNQFQAAITELSSASDVRAVVLTGKLVKEESKICFL